MTFEQVGTPETPVEQAEMVLHSAALPAVQLPPAIKEQIDAVIQQAKMTDVQAATVLECFTSDFAPFLELKTEAEGIAVEDVDEREKIERAKEIDQILLNVDKRLGEIHKERKEQYLRPGQLLDGIRRTYGNAIADVRTHLKRQFDFVRLKEKEKFEKVAAERQVHLDEVECKTPVPGLGAISEEQFALILAGAKAEFDRRKAEAELSAQAAIANARRIARINRLSMNGLVFDGVGYSYEELTLSESQISELDDLTFDLKVSQIIAQVAGRKIAAATAEAEKKVLAERRLARINRLLAIGMTLQGADYVYEELNFSEYNINDEPDEAFEADFAMIAPEIQKRKDAKTQAAADAEALRLENERIARENADKIAKEKAEAERLAAETKAKELAPDRDKLLAFADSLETLPKPALNSLHGILIVAEVDLREIIATIRTEVEKAAPAPADIEAPF